ncbi:MAG: hypothetical protein CMJ31_13605 [Phycisphaerae bacterium]|nr:hypothetical protein [Phycisphaerae bacterium]
MTRPDRLARLGRGTRNRESSPAHARALGSWLASRLKFTRVVCADGVRYTPHGRRNRETSLARAYEVTFPDAPTIRIHPTPARVFDDLTPDPLSAAVESLAPALRPGGRALVIGCGTGAPAFTIARAIGRAGGVIATDTDAESIRFARRRYPMDNLGFERGGIESLDQEVGPSFDAVLVPARYVADQAMLIRLLESLLRPADLCFHGAPNDVDRVEALVRLHASPEQPEPITLWRSTGMKLVRAPLVARRDPGHGDQGDDRHDTDDSDGNQGPFGV